MKLSRLLILAFILLAGSPAYAADFTFGKLTDGISTTAVSTDNKAVSTSTPTSTGTIKSAVARLRLVSSTLPTVFKAVVYSDSAGAPGSLLATSDEGNVTSTSVSPITVTFSGAAQITVNSGTQYWVGIHIKDPGAANYVIYRDNDTNAIQYNADTYVGGATDPFGAPSNLNGKIDLYINASTTAGRTKTASTTSAFPVAPINSGGTWVTTFTPDDIYTKQVLIQRDAFNSLFGQYLYIEGGEVKFMATEEIIGGTTDGIWSGGTLATSTTYTVALSYAFDGADASNPIMCLNGVATAFTEDSSPVDIADGSLWKTLYVAGLSNSTSLFTGTISDVYYITDDLTGNALCNLTAGVSRVGLYSSATNHYWPLTGVYSPGTEITSLTAFKDLRGSSSMSMISGLAPPEKLTNP